MESSIYVFETHHISPECNGNGNGLFVITNSCSRSIEWLVLRLVNSGVKSEATPYLILVERANTYALIEVSDTEYDDSLIIIEKQRTQMGRMKVQMQMEIV